MTTPRNTPESGHRWNAETLAGQPSHPGPQHTGVKSFLGNAFTFQPQINPRSERIAAKIYKETEEEGSGSGTSGGAMRNTIAHN